MSKSLLHTEFLKFLLDNNKSFDFVEVNSFLLKNFPEEINMNERRKMHNFLNFLISEGYIEVKSKRGIHFIVESGQKIKRDEVSAIVKIKPKGVNLVEKNILNNYSKNFTILNSVLSISTLILGVYSFFLTQNASNMELKIEDLKSENTSLKRKINNIENQVLENKIIARLDTISINLKNLKFKKPKK